MAKTNTPEDSTTEALTPTQLARMQAGIDVPANLDSMFDGVDLRGSEFSYESLLSDADDATNVIGDGFNMTEKNTLKGVPMVIIDWRHVIGTYGTFTVVRAFTKDKRRVRFIDGGTGVHEQLTKRTADLQAAGIKTIRPLRVEGGLTASEYDYLSEAGELGRGTTFYLATA